MRFFNLFEPFQKKHIQLGDTISVISGRSENAEVDTEKILTDSPMTKNRLMVTIHSKDVPKILPLNRMTKFDFPPHFLVRLMHSFPMMYNTI